MFKSHRARQWPRSLARIRHLASDQEIKGSSPFAVMGVWLSLDERRPPKSVISPVQIRPRPPHPSSATDREPGNREKRFPKPLPKVQIPFPPLSD